MTERYTCGKCLMKFIVQDPAHRKGIDPAWTRCAVPKCGRRFWHSEPVFGRPANVGVWPDPLADVRHA